MSFLNALTYNWYHGPGMFDSGTPRFERRTLFCEACKVIQRHVTGTWSQRLLIPSGFQSRCARHIIWKRDTLRTGEVLRGSFFNLFSCRLRLADSSELDESHRIFSQFHRFYGRSKSSPQPEAGDIWHVSGSKWEPQLWKIKQGMTDPRSKWTSKHVDWNINEHHRSNWWIFQQAMFDYQRACKKISIMEDPCPSCPPRRYHPCSLVPWKTSLLGYPVGSSASGCNGSLKCL